MLSQVEEISRTSGGGEFRLSRTQEPETIVKAIIFCKPLSTFKGNTKSLFYMQLLYFQSFRSGILFSFWYTLKPYSRQIFGKSTQISAASSQRIISMQERRQSSRYVVSFPNRVRWKDENGNEVVEEGLTENVGQSGTLIYLPRKLPPVGSKVDLTVAENLDDEVTVIAQVIRLERNAAHPQVALNLVEGMRTWKKKVWEYAGQTVAGMKPEELDDW